jgi:C1A family cysteine protease
VGAFALLATLAAASAGQAQEATATPTIAPLNPAFVKYMDDRANGRPEGYVKFTSDGHPLGFIPSTLDLSHLKGKPGLAAQLGTSLPSNYDLRPLGRVSPVKNQEGCGDCWAFASYGSMESVLLPTENWDFSENNLNNLNGFDTPPCQGGSPQISTAYLTRWAGPINASDDPDPESTGAACTSQSDCPSPASLSPQKHVQGVYWIAGRANSTDNANLKAAIMTYGGVAAGISGTELEPGSPYFNASTDAYYYNGDPVCGGKVCGTDHNITLVGWDDNYAASNFTKTPPGNGAFLIKNSWGTYWGSNGFFWASYYDVNVAVEESYVFADNELPSNYTTVYQYDPLGLISPLGFNNTPSAYEANVFTAGANGQLEAVSAYAMANATTYTVEIYTNASSGPTSGSLATTTSGVIASAGYNTIVLPSPVAITKGQKFSVVIQLKSPGTTNPLGISFAVQGYSSKATGTKGNGFLSPDGNSWTDVTSVQPTASICLKAFVNPSASTLSLGGFSVTPATTTSGATASLNLSLSAVAPTGGAVISLASNNSTVFPVPSTYTIPAGQTSATPSVVVGTVTASTTVTLTATYNGSSMQAKVVVNPSTLPVVASVSAILPQQSQTITITGKGFGAHAAYSGNSSYIAVNLPTWGAGYSGPGANDAVGLVVTSWTDTQIVLAGFMGSYAGAWTIQQGNPITIEVWNAQTGAGPGVCGNIVAGAGPTICAPPPILQVTPTTAVAFGSVVVGLSSTQAFTVKNSGGGTLAGTASVAAPFTISSGAIYSLAAGATQTVTVKFSPTAAQSYSQKVAFTGGAGASGTVTGTGVAAPAISVTPTTAVAFGSVNVGASSTQNFTVKNTGGGTLAGTASVAAPFSISSGASYNLAAGATQTVAVKFSPAAAQAYSQKVTFTGGAGATGTVTGTGTAVPSFTVTANKTTQTITRGQSASFTLTVQSKNCFHATVTPTALNLPTHYVASGTKWNPATVTAIANGTASSTLTVATDSTTTPGTYNVTLQAAATGYTTQTVPVSLVVNAAAKAPTVTTGAATAITGSTATINGTVNPNGADARAWFLIDVTSSMSTAVQCSAIDEGAGTASVPAQCGLTQMSPNSKYYFQLVAQNSVGKVSGAVVSFTTAAAKLPTVTTGAASAITGSTATINGTVNPNGTDTQAWFLVDVTSSMSTAVQFSSFDAGSGITAVPSQCTLYQMSPNSTYYYEFVAQNSAGTVKGSIGHFTTASHASVPHVTSRPASRPSPGPASIAGASSLPLGMDVLMQSQDIAAVASAAPRLPSTGSTVSVPLTAPNARGQGEMQGQSPRR